MKSAVLFLVVCLSMTYSAVVLPPGVHTALCPNYPYCDGLDHGELIPPERQPKLAVYPPGIEAFLCPNYPFCEPNWRAEHNLAISS